MTSKSSWNTHFHAPTPELAEWANAQLPPHVRELLADLPPHKRPYVEEYEAECEIHGTYKAKRFGYGKYATDDDGSASGAASSSALDQADPATRAAALAAKAQYRAAQAGPSRIKTGNWAQDHVTSTQCPACLAAKRAATQSVDAAATEQGQEPPMSDVTRRLLAANIPLRFQDKTLRGFATGLRDNPSSWTSQQKHAVREACTDYVMRFDQPKTGHLAQGRSLLLLGNTNTGKTHVACAIVKAIIQKGLQAQYVAMSDMTRSITDTWGSNTEGEVYQRYQSPDLLVIDDVKTIGINQTDSKIFCEIIDKRYNSMKPTVIISNNADKDLHTTFSQQAFNIGDTVRFNWR